MADDDVMMPPAPAEVLAAAIDTVVAAMVASRWPTTPAEFAVWADGVGLFRATPLPRRASSRENGDAPPGPIPPRAPSRACGEEPPQPSPHRAEHRACGEELPDVSVPIPFPAAASSPESSAASHPIGEPEPELDELMPWATHFHAPGHPWMLSWHFSNDAFVGVAMFPGADLDPVELRQLGLALRDRFDARWEAAESLHDVPPLTGFTSFWLTGACSVDLYWHAPRVDPFGDASSGAVQLAVSHHARARAEDDEAAARMTRGG